MNNLVFFVSDLHGHISRYKKLFEAIRSRKPALVLLGGDLLPHPLRSRYGDFILEFLSVEFQMIRNEMDTDYPVIGLILGNDDARIFEDSVIACENQGLWKYLHMRSLNFAQYTVIGYSYIPPTPFLLKDWERYDVSRFVDPGCVPPTRGRRTVEVNMDEVKYATIEKDLASLMPGTDLKRSILLTHSPPYNCDLDRAALDGMSVEHAPLDVHVGSIALQRFIAEKHPYLTLHGHVHESSRLTGQWLQQFGKTVSMNAAWDGEELSLISFDISEPGKARRELII